MTGPDSPRSPVWITRTQPAAGRLADQCGALHLDYVIQPLLDIEQLAPAMPSEHVDVGICLSVHAARCLVGQSNLANRWLCVGEATAVALASSLGLSEPSVEYPKQATSEALVVLLSSQLAASDTVLIACGVGGRGVLEAALQAQGCSVTRLELYRRSPAQLSAIPEACAVEIASSEALDALAVSGWNKRQALVVASTRLAELAATKGFENVHNSDGAEPQRVAATLAAIARAP